MNRSHLILALSILLAPIFIGCWSFNVTEYPAVTSVALPPGTNVVLGVNGFAATLTDYAALQGFQTVYVPGHCGRRHYHPGYFTTVSTVSYVPQTRTTDAYLLRAKDAFERAGFAVGAATPDWTVDVAFAGPFQTNEDALKELGWLVGTLFLCDYSAESWTAQLRVRDNRTGRLVYHNDYVQRYEANVFGLIPLFSVASATETSSAFMQGWCLGALTDRIVADVTAHFSGRRSEGTRQ